jgi:hypothetical protein
MIRLTPADAPRPLGVELVEAQHPLMGWQVDRGAAHAAAPTTIVSTLTTGG